MEEICKDCIKKDKLLDERNVATKAWIDSDTQCRAYANELQKKILELQAKLLSYEKKTI